MILSGCAGGAPKQTGEQKAEAGRDIDQTSTQTQWVVNALDAARERLGAKWQEKAMLAGASFLLVVVGACIILGCTDSPVKGHWRAIFLIVGLSLLASPAILIIVYIWSGR